MRHVSIRRRPLWPLALFFLLVSCDGERQAPVRTVSSDAYRVEILTPGGVFREGRNEVTIRAWHDEQPVAIHNGQFDFFMPWLDMQPHMRAHTCLSGSTSSKALTGRLHFAMDGIWDGRFEVITEAGPVRGALRIEVVE